MKKPPPPPLQQQEPSYHSPPPPLQEQEPLYHSPPPSQQQEPSQEPILRGPRITYIPPRRVFHTPNENFKSLVQRLTGKSPTSSPQHTPAPNYTFDDDSPAMEMYNGELEKTKPGLGFAGDVETTYQYYHHQNGDNQPPNLSPRTDSLWAELSSTMTPQDLEFLASLLLSPRHHQPPTSSTPQCDNGPPKRPRFDLGHEGVGRFNGVGGMGRPGGDNLYMGGELMPGRGGVFPPGFGPNGTRGFGFGQQDLAGRPLPPDASSTLFVEGLPSDCSMREAAHIFRPFSGYKEVRLVTKDSKQRDGDPIILCFVDFENPACAATARNVLQGYRMDEEERDSKILRIQFSRNPGPRPGGQRGGRRW